MEFFVCSRGTPKGVDLVFNNPALNPGQSAEVAKILGPSMLRGRHARGRQICEIQTAFIGRTVLCFCER